MPASVSNERIVDRQASSVNSVPSRRSSTRALGSVGGASVWMSAQQRSKIVARSSDGTLSVLRSAVQRADTNRTNCKSGIPGFWISNDGMAEHYRWQPTRSQRAQCPRLQLDVTTEDEEYPTMITISLMGQLQTADGERDLACHVPSPMSVRQV